MRAIGLLGAFATLASLGAMSGCASTGGVTSEAATDVRAFAIALRDRDLGGIESRIDRPALQNQVNGLARSIASEEISRRVGGGGAGTVMGMFGADLAAPVIERLARRALEPDMLADFARKAGITPETRAPGRFVTSLALRNVGDGRVCAPDPQTRSCLLYFAKYPTGWKLNALDETTLRAKLAPAPSRPAR